MLSMAGGEGRDIAKDRTGCCSATTAFTASSFLREATVLGGSPMAKELKNSALPPEPAAKPQGLLVKVKTGRGLRASTINAAAIVGLPCRLTLRGKRQTQEHRNNSDDDDGRRAYTAKISSPRRRPLIRRVVIDTKPGSAVGYSPRLRSTEAEVFTEGGDTTIDFFVEPSPRTPLQGVASRGANATNAACGAAVSTLPTAVGPLRLTPSAHRAKITPCGGCFHVDDAGAVAKSKTADFGRGKARTHEAPHVEHIAITQEYRLCGRLRKGSTAPPQKKLVDVNRHDRGGASGGDPTITRPPRTLFLVSGQQQQLPVDAAGARGFSTRKMAPLQRRNQTKLCESSRVFPAVSLASATGSRAKTVPSGGLREPRSGGWNLDRVRVSGKDANGREGDKEVLLPEWTSGPANEEEHCDAASAEAADAEEGFASSGKRVLHVRVPRPPSTSRLMLRSAAPRTSVLRSK